MFGVLDWIIIAIILISTLIGFMSGFLRSVLGVIVWLASFLCSMFFGSAIAGYFAVLDSPGMQLWLAYGVVFLATMLVGWLFKLLLGSLLISTERSIVNAALGGLFGLIRGILLILILALFLVLSGAQESALYRASALMPMFAGLATGIASFFPGVSEEMQAGMSKLSNLGQMTSGSGSGESAGGSSSSESGVSSGSGVASSVGGAIATAQSGFSQVVSSIKGNLGNL